MSDLISPLPPFPETAWRGPFRMYRDLVEDVSVCPLPYHFANLLAILSAQMGDFAVLDEGVDTFLNFYLFSYGRTGTKKSTAMKMADQHVLKRLPVERMHFRDLSSISSAEGLIRTLAVAPHNVLLRYDEVKHLFAVASRSGQAIEPVLNKAFDLEVLETVVRNEKESLKATDYFLTLIVNGTPVHISIDVGEAMFHGGLLNRFLVFAAMPTGKTKARMGTPDAFAANELAQKLDQHVWSWRNFGAARGGIRIAVSDDAIALFDPWYESVEQLIQTANELIADPIQRVSVYAKKLAAVYCLWELPFPTMTPIITGPQMQAAIDVVSYCQASIIFMSGAWTGAKSLGARSEALAETRIEMFLQEHGCTVERELSKLLHMGIGETKKAVTALMSVQVVQIGLEKPAKIHYVERCVCYTTKGENQ